MATKSDLIEAQTFSRRRLLTAFVSGAPGGKELEPSSPLRAVIAAIALTVGVILVGVFYGLIKPGLPSGWDNGKLILVTDTGARFVTVDGTLHPVINTASARLLIPSTEFSVISTDQQNLSGVELGSTLGIVGAPDDLPAPDALVNAGWNACPTEDAEVDLRIGGSGPRATTDAAVVEADGSLYVVSGERSFAVPRTDTDAVLRAAGITAADATEVSAAWLNLFIPGTPLEPLTVADAGRPVPGTDLRVGEVVHIADSPEDERLLVQPNGSLSPLSPLAWQLYLLGSGSDLTGATDVSGAAVAALPSGKPAGGADWPESGFSALAGDQRPCALLSDDGDGARTVLAAQDADTSVTAGTTVRAGAGALVRAGGRGDQSTGIVTLVDATGTAYPLPGATAETVARLGYTVDDIGLAGQGWIALLQTGPSLTETAAGTSPDGGEGVEVETEGGSDG